MTSTRCALLFFHGLSWRPCGRKAVAVQTFADSATRPLCARCVAEARRTARANGLRCEIGRMAL